MPSGNSVRIDATLDESGVVQGAKRVTASLDEIKKADQALNWNGIEDGSTQMNEAQGHAEVLAGGIGKLGGKLAAIGGAAAGAFGLSAFVDYATASSEASARLTATLAGTGRSAEEFDGVLQNIYAANYGEGFDDIAEAANQVIQIIGSDIEPAALESITEKAIVLRDTFGMDVPESVKAAQVMMQNFGISSDEAFDMLAKGAQEGLNINGDMLDSFSEYSPYFKQLGLDASDMFNAFASGADISMYGVDKAGDAFKEFGIRVVDGSNTTREAFAAMGLDADAYAAKIMEGGPAARQATTEIISALLAIEDPVERNAQGVALFGTQWEDLGQDGAEAMLALMGQAVECEGTLQSIDSVRYDSLGSAFEGIKRSIEVSVFQPISDQVLPALSSLASWFTENQETITGAINAAFTALNTIAPVLAGIAAGYAAWVAYSEAVKVLTALQTAYNAVVKAGSVAQLAINAAMRANPIGIVITAITGLVAAFTYLWNTSEEFRNFWIGLWNAISSTIKTVWNAITSAVKTGINTVYSWVSDKVNLVKSVWSTCWNAISSVAKTIWSTINSVIKSGVSFVQDKFNALKSFASSVWNGIKNVIVKPIQSAWNTITGIIDRLKSAFNFKWSLPKIKLPHLSISGSFSINPPSVPSFGISWYAKGGVFNGPSVIGVGEAGPEGVIPFNKRGAMPLAAGIAEQLSVMKNNIGDTSVTINMYATVREEADIRKISREIAKEVRRTELGQGAFA